MNLSLVLLWARWPTILALVGKLANARSKSFGRECRVIEVCNPRHAQMVLNQAIEISTALPCRISVYEEDGRTILATIKPTALLTMFNAPGAAATAKEVETTMVRIMDETCQG